MKRRILTAGILLSALLLAGCARMMLQPPSVTLAHMEVVEVGLFEQRFAFKLRVMNPNKAEIAITGLSFEVELNNESFAKGVSSKPVTVPRMGEALLDVTAVSGLTGVLRQITEVARGTRDEMIYRIKGRLVTDSHGTLNFDERGVLDFRKLGK